MPILQFTDLSGNAVKYDFSEMEFCRLAAMHVTFKDLLAHKQGQMSEDYLQAALMFVNMFDTLYVSLNEISASATTLTMKDIGFNKENVNVLTAIGLELLQIYNALDTLRDHFDDKHFPSKLLAENKYLLEGIKCDLHYLMDKVQKEKKKIEHLETTLNEQDNYSLDAYIVNRENRWTHSLLQIRDFFNIYHVDARKPDLSLFQKADVAVREASRIAGYVMGSALGITSGFFAKVTGSNDDSATMEAAKAAELWLKSWNDKHQPSDPTLRNRPTNT